MPCKFTQPDMTCGNPEIETLDGVREFCIEGLCSDIEPEDEPERFIIAEEIIIDDSIKYHSDNEDAVKNFCDKMNVANELLKNTSNIFLKEFIKEYLFSADIPQERADLVRFGKCIDYIKAAGFDITAWQLFEIPIYYSYCFYNEKTDKEFSLSVWDKEAIPTYLHYGNEMFATSIDDAIKLNT